MRTSDLKDELSVLLVEDDEPLASALIVNLRAEGWDVEWASTTTSALAACRSRPFDVVVLDLMLPGGSGLDVCAALRLDGAAPGIVMLTSRGSEADVVLGLDHGADDYVTKPCRPRELVARIRAVTRRVQARAGSGASTPDLVRGPLRVDLRQRRAWVGDAEVTLTPTEHELLATLALDERVHARTELLERVFDTTHAGYLRNVDCHVARLRRKLKAAGLDGAIKTVYGSGYRFEVET